MRNSTLTTAIESGSLVSSPIQLVEPQPQHRKTYHKWQQRRKTSPQPRQPQHPRPQQPQRQPMVGLRPRVSPDREQPSMRLTSPTRLARTTSRQAQRTVSPSGVNSWTSCMRQLQRKIPKSPVTRMGPSSSSASEPSPILAGHAHRSSPSRIRVCSQPTTSSQWFVARSQAFGFGSRKSSRAPHGATRRAFPRSVQSTTTPGRRSAGGSCVYRLRKGQHVE